MNQNHEVQNILQVFDGYRMPPSAIDLYEAKGRSILADKISPYVSLGKQIPFVMLGFPFKSTNQRDKVLGVKPDMGEQLTLNNFSRFNADIKEVYAPGAKIQIVSDGFIFNDLLGVSNNIVDDYLEISKDMGRKAPMEWYNLTDFYHTSTVTAREKVVDQWGITAEELEQRILLNPNVNWLYRGMIIFMKQEIITRGYPNNSQLEKAAKKLAREMMFRNEAYSNLVRKEFASSIRLSMHPSVNDGEKYSFQLINSPNAHHSAWHSAILKTSEGVSTVHRKDAEDMGAELVYKDNQPFYFQK